MSQNKTIVPGVNYDNPQNNEYEEAVFGSLYSRSGTDDNRTCIAGSPAAAQAPYDKSNSVEGHAAAPGTGNSSFRHIMMQERVVVGCLFSISHGLLGEIFPLYLGRNIIGYTPNCDVCLKEKTVSSEHAILYIRKEGHPANYFMTITDYNSEYGSAVNGNDGRYETLTVRENDVITIGRHYKLLVKIFDVETAGLDEDTEFEEMEIQQTYNSIQTGGNNVPPAVSNEFYTPTRNKDESERTVIY